MSQADSHPLKQTDSRVIIEVNATRESRMDDD
jgi:hypothetical protein